jgi:hypothetical protein
MSEGMNNNYQSALERINKANDAESLLKVEESLERLWNAGIFTRDQFSKLDDILVEKLISIDPYKFG